MRRGTRAESVKDIWLGQDLTQECGSVPPNMCELSVNPGGASVSVLRRASYSPRSVAVCPMREEKPSPPVVAARLHAPRPSSPSGSYTRTSDLQK